MSAEDAGYDPGQPRITGGGPHRCHPATVSNITNAIQQCDIFALYRELHMP